MRSAIALLLCLVAVSSASQLTFNVNDFAHVAKGVVEGVGIAEGWTDVAPCFSSSEDAVQNVIQAVALLKKQDATDVARGLALLGKALQDLPLALQSCGAVVQDVKVLVHALQAIANPSSLIFNSFKNLLVNGVEIYHEVFAAVDAFHAGDWEKFGLNIGEALSQIFLKGCEHETNANEIVPVENTFLFIRGVVEGLSVQTDYSQLAVCFADVQSVAFKLDEAINDFVSQKTEKVIAGVKLLGSALQEFPTALQVCKVAGSEVEGLVRAIAQLRDPRSLVYKISRSLLVNGQEIWSEISATSAAWRNGNYEAAGKEVGTLLANFIAPEKKVLGAGFAHFVSERSAFDVDTNNKFSNWTVAELKSLVGTQIVDLATTDIIGVNTDNANAELPKSFSAYEQWPECKHDILNQEHCGSCWAFSAAEALADRLCIASQGKFNLVLSPQYLVSCSTGNMGCNGGMLTLAWRSLEHSGIPTLDCQPYVSGDGVNVPACSKLSTCQDGSAQKNYFAKSLSTRWYMSVNSMKTELMTNGPIQSAFQVYEDFMTYKGGVYRHTTGGLLGGHAIKVVGWGEENGEEYWTVANSWGPDWGEAGHFRILIGSSGIDSSGVSGKADVAAAEKSYAQDLFLF